MPADSPECQAGAELTPALLLLALARRLGRAPFRLRAQPGFFFRFAGKAFDSGHGLFSEFPDVMRGLDPRKVRDLIVAVTGLPKTDAIVKYMLNTFQAFQEYAKGATDTRPPKDDESRESEEAGTGNNVTDNRSQNAALQAKQIGVAYNFNIILPETTNIEVFNSIFRSLKENLLK
jgi:hypothetical protein